MNPCNLRWGCAEVERLACYEIPSDFEQPQPEPFSTGNFPPPGGREFPNNWKMLADVLIPIGQLITEIKDGLHVIAEHRGGQPIGSVIDDCKLADRAVLALINDETIITIP